MGFSIAKQMHHGRESSNIEQAADKFQIIAFEKVHCTKNIWYNLSGILALRRYVEVITISVARK